MKQSKAPKNHLAALVIRSPEPPKVPADPGKYGEYIDAYRMYVQEVESIRRRVAIKRAGGDGEGETLPDAGHSSNVGDRVRSGGVVVDIVAKEEWTVSATQTVRSDNDHSFIRATTAPGIGPHFLDRDEKKYPFVVPNDEAVQRIDHDEKVRGKPARLRTGYTLSAGKKREGAQVSKPGGSKSEPRPLHPKGKQVKTPAATVVTAGALAKRKPSSTKVDASRSFASVAKQPVAANVAREEIARAAIRSMRVERKLGNATKAAGFGYAWARSGTLVLKKASETGSQQTLVFPRKRLGGDRSFNPATAKAEPAKGTPLKPRS